MGLLGDILNSRRRRPRSFINVYLYILRISGLFDGFWYRSKYPDLANFEGALAEHYLNYGGREKRDPSPIFGAADYATANPDIALDRHNPLIHYICCGAQEGRPSGTLQGSAVTFSIVLMGKPSRALRRTYDSVALLFGAKMELIVSDGAVYRRVKARLYPLDINVTSLNSSEFSNSSQQLYAALQKTSHEFCVIVQAGDELKPDALLKLAAFIRISGADIVYTDELIYSSSFPRGRVTKKPRWSPQLLQTTNYFGRLTAIRRSVAVRCQPYELPGFSLQAAEWALYLKAVGRTTAIEKLPEVLCRRDLRRCDTESGSGSDETAMTAALSAHWRDKGHVAEVRRLANGSFHSSLRMNAPALVSIIVPNTRSASSMEACLRSISAHTAYEAYEIIVVDDFGDPGPGGLEAIDHRIRVERISQQHPRHFTYYSACNHGASIARGRLLVFLDGALRADSAHWLDELVQCSVERDVAIVAPDLLDADGRSFRSSVRLEPGLVSHGSMDTTRRDASDHDDGAGFLRNVSAVAGGCQLVTRDVFRLSGGFDETFETRCGDVALCVIAAKLGFRSVLSPFAVLRHQDAGALAEPRRQADCGALAGLLRRWAVDSDFYLDAMPCRAPDTKASSDRNDLSAADDTLRSAIERHAGAPTTPIDIYNVGAVASAAGRRWSDITWNLSLSAASPDARDGARLLLQLMLTLPHVRRRFPTGISEGADGAFAAWVRTEGLQLLGLGEAFVPAIDAAFAAHFGSVSRKILAYDTSFRREQPLFLLPAGRAATCRTLFRAHWDGVVPIEDVWWYLIEHAEMPEAALCETWAITPRWQSAVPAGGTIFGIDRLARWVSHTYGVVLGEIVAERCRVGMSDAAQIRLAYAAHSDWQRAFPRAMDDAAEARGLIAFLRSSAAGLPDFQRKWLSDRSGGVLAQQLARPGINMLAHLGYPSGLRVSSESIVAGLRENGFDVSLRNVPVSADTDEPVGGAVDGCELYDITLIHVQPEPFFEDVYARADLLDQPGRGYRIGYWYWEFDDVPPSWQGIADRCDEIWTATEFVASGLRTALNKPVGVYFPGIEIGAFDLTPRAEFGISDSDYVFVFAFHLTSVMERKNPLGLIAAFRAAFGDEPRAKLIIKVSFGARHPSGLTDLRTAAEGANVQIIDQVSSRDRTLSLISASDAYVSLHRSEGLGLSIAEAMLLGRPVIATGYSGNLQFMTAENSLLVDYRLVTMEHDTPPYTAGQTWAEPSIADASSKMRMLFDNPELGRALGARAKRNLQEQLNYRVTGHAVAERLRTISERRRKP